MKNKIKGLLALVLSVLIGQAWAADPVATWTDFNTLTSGNYTITKDPSCTVNTDGSITLGGAGLTLPVSGNQVTVVMEVSGVPTESGITVVSVKMGSQYVSLKSNGTQLIQSWNNGGDYGTFDWTPANRQTIVLGTMQSNPSGTTTWIDGVQKVTRADLMTTVGSLGNVYIGSYNGTATGSAAGMIVHSLRLYSTKLSGDEVVSDIIANGGTVAAPVVINSDETLETSRNLNFSNGGNAINVRGTLNVLSGEVTFNAGNESVNGTVNISEGATFVATKEIFGSSGAVTGAGKLVVNDYPNESIRTSLGRETWTGTYVNTANNTLQDNSNWLGAVGNANSIVEFTGASTGYLKQAGSMNAALKVTGSITFSNGFSSNGGYTFNGALLGTGTVETVNAPTDVLKFLGETKDFAGTIKVAGGHCIAFGEQADDDSKQGMIVIAAGKTANIAAGKTWTAVNGIEVAGTIGGEGTIGSALILADGATLAGAVTVTGNVTVEGAVNVTHATAAGETIITCANAEAVASALTGAPEGLRYVAEDGAVKLAAIPVSNNVAKIGETEYETLQAAIDAAGANATVELLADTKENITVPAGFTGTIDLGGKTVTGYLAGSNVELVLQNGYIIHNTGNKPAIKITGGSLELNNIYLESHYHGIQVDGTATCIINSGTYKLTSGASGYALVYPYNANASITVNGGNFYGAEETNDVPALFKSKGLVTVNGGYFQRNLGYTVYISSGNVVITGGEFNGLRNYTGTGSGSGIVEYGGGKFTNDPTSADARERMASGYKVDENVNPGYFTVVEKPAIQLTIDLGDGVSSVAYKIGETTTTIDKDTTIDIAESGTVVSFTATVNGNYFAPTVADVTVTQTRTVTIAGIAFSEVESADAAITDANRNVVYAWAKNKGKSQSEVSAANYLYADYLFNFAEFSAAEPTIEITEFTADPLVIKAKVTVNGETKIADLSVTGLNLNGTLKYKAAATLEALEAATPKAALDATDRFFKVVVE